MSGPRLTAAESRAMDRAVKVSTRAKTLAWAKATLDQHPFRSDLRDLIANLELNGANSRHGGRA